MRYTSSTTTKDSKFTAKHWSQFSIYI